MITRHKKILTTMSDGQRVTVNELAAVLGVSQATVRQDLTILEDQGFLRRVHGGAIMDETDDISHRMGINYESKVKIARLAATFVQEGETIFIESGSINALLAKEVSKIPNTTIITSNAFIARQIGKDTQGNLILLGGIYQPESESLVGNLVSICLEHINFSKAFIGFDGFTPQSGFTGRDMMRVETHKLVLKKSPEVFMLTDSSKFGKIALSRICSADQIDYLITDEGIPKDYLEAVKKAGAQVLIT